MLIFKNTWVPKVFFRTRKPETRNSEILGLGSWPQFPDQLSLVEITGKRKNGTTTTSRRGEDW